MSTKTTREKAYCNCLAQQRGLDPVGHAGSFDDAVVIEAPLPWRHDMTQRAGALSQQVIDLLELWLQQYNAGGGYPHYLLVVAPDPVYSRAGFRRVMFYTRPAGLFAHFEKVEYLVPVAEVGSLVWSWYQERPRLLEFEPYRVSEMDAVRDILVCTHGTVDAACARFGYPLYSHMRETYCNDHLRVWRVSHFGGHVFAPTLMEMPSGHSWAFVGPEQAAQIVRRQGDPGALRGHYRGWMGLSEGFLQAADYDLWQRHGWAWFDYRKRGEILAQDYGTNPQWAEVNIRFLAREKDIETGVILRVEISHCIETEISTARADPYPYPQYRVAPP